MADDLDDLLDEVESKFCKDAPPKSTSKPKTSQENRTTTTTREEAKNKKRSTKRKGGGEDLSDIIKDICEDDGLEIPVISPPIAGSSKGTNEPSSHKSKCFNLLLGGTRFTKGLCTVSAERICDQLRCTSCDFKVVIFDNYSWDKDCDYLFFRNNVPDFQKLKSKLITRRGSCAYACQCSWRSVTELIEVQTDGKLKWVCGKHS